MAWFGFGRKKKSAAGEEHVQSDVISVPIRELHSRSDLSQLADESALLPDGMPYIGEPSLKPLDVATSITDESSTMNNSEDSPSPVPVSEKKIDTASRSTSEVSGHSLEKSNSENLGQYYTDGESKESFSIEENWYAVKGSDESIDYYQKGLLIDEPEQARKLFLKAAEKGNRKAQEKLAEMLFSGVGGPVDYSEAVTWFLASGPEDGEPEYQLAQCYEKLGNSEAAFEWYEMAAIHEVPSAKQDFLKIKANTGDVESQYLLGMELFSDLANPENRKEALVCLETASNSGHLGAQERLVAIYLEGEESLQDISRAMYWHKRIGLHDPEREFLFAEHYREAERIEDAICWYEKADVGGHAEAWRKCLQMKAETGDVHFQHDLALAYISGERIEKNIKKATEWLEKAATKGQREAQYELGKLLLSAETDDSNQQDGVAWLELAAEAGLEEAARVLFENYLDGDLIAEDPVLAARWFDQLGDDDGAIAFALGEAFLRQENQEDAIRWFKKAEEYGHPNATLQCLLIKAQSGTAYSQYSLAVAYASGDGVEQDHSKAVEWYRKAAVQGHAGAQNNLGFCYSRGAGVAKDPVEEVKWYRRAAEQADSTAESNLGLCYRYGTGVEKNLEEAARWFQKAVAQGNETAKKHLEEVKGELVNQSKAERKKLGIFPGIFFEEGSLIAEWLESLEEVGPGLGWTMVAATGSGPLQVEMMDNLLRDNDIDPAYCGDDGASVLIVGREGWTEEDLESHIEARAGESIYIYSQEMAMLALLTGHDPFDLDEEILLEFGTGHPALEFLMQHEFTWPVVTQGWSDIYVDADDWHAGSPLTAMGYHVGKTSDLTTRARHKLLENIYRGRLVFPVDFSPSEQREWGRPGSKGRLEKIATHIARHISLMNTRSGYEVAVGEWQSDLDWMQKEFYRPSYSFGWPS